MSSEHDGQAARIDHDDYQVSYDAGAGLIACSGTFRLRGEEYAEVSRILDEAAEHGPRALLLDLRAVEFLNSSGINTISKFVLKLRRKGGVELTVRGSESVAWQRKSLRNFERLLPGTKLDMK